MSHLQIYNKESTDVLGILQGKRIRRLKKDFRIGKQENEQICARNIAFEERRKDNWEKLKRIRRNGEPLIFSKKGI